MVKKRLMAGYVAAIASALLLSGAAAFAQSAARLEDLKQAIDYLLDTVEHSDASFVRNDRTYTGKEAAAHMKAKYDYFKREIKTPEDFIRLAASKSLISGQPYLVKTRDGREFKSAEWLAKTLSDYRGARKNSQKSLDDGPGA